MDTINEYSTTPGFVFSNKIEIQDLENRGKCIVAKNSIKPNELLMRIPLSALVNTKTCKYLPPPELDFSTHELLAENLALISNSWKSNLPKNFHSMPVAWNISDINLLPPFLRTKVALQRSQINTFITKSQHSKELAEWAWLAVNTRCLYWEEGGMTLAPILDFLNHSSDELLNAEVKSGPFGFTVKSKREYIPNEEITFSYGAHDDGFLLTEYGFVNLDDNEFNYVDISDKIKPIVLEHEKFLKQNNYWGEYTIDFNGEPSYRLEVALACLHDLKYAKQMILGYEDGTKVSSSNRSVLLPIANELIEEYYSSVNQTRNSMIQHLLNEYINILSKFVSSS